MDASDLLSTYFRNSRMPKCINCHFINEEHSNKHSFLPHTHDNYLELLYVYSGAGQYMVDSKYYDIKEGDIVTCNAGILHGKRAESTCNIRSYSIGITSLSFHNLPDNWIASRDTQPVISCGMLSEQIGEMFRLIYLLSPDKKHLSNICNCISLSIILLTRELILSRYRNETIRTRSSASATAERIRHYLDQHYRESLTLSAIGKTLHISEYYLSHIFKDEFGVPPMQYVMKRRIGEAQNLLMDTDMPIGDIADYLGFSSISHLNTMFSKYIGIPPGKYRQSVRNMDET